MEVRCTASDGVTLVGALDLPKRTDPAPVVVAVHASGAGTRAAPLHEHLSRILPAHGIGTFVFDRRGEGMSDGDPDATLSRLADDVVAAVERVRAEPGVDPERIGLWAHSQGGWIAPLAAARSPAIRWLVVVGGAGVSPEEQMAFAVERAMRAAGFGDDDIAAALATRRRLTRAVGAADPAAASAFDEARRRPWFDLAHLPDPADRVAPGFEHDLDLRPVLGRLRLPTLLVYGERDRWVPIDASIDVWRRASAAPDRLAVHRIAGTGHLPTIADDPDDPDERGPIAPAYERLLLAWLTDVVGD